MIEFLGILFIWWILNAAFIIGLHGVTRDGYLLGFVERWWRKETLEHSEWELDIKWKRKAVQDIKVIMHKMHDEYDHSDLDKPLDLEDDFQRLTEEVKKAEYFLEENLKIEPEKWTTPAIANSLTECPTCMSSVWGLAGYFSLYAILDLPWPYLFGAAPYCIALAGLLWGSREMWGERE